MDGVVCSSIGTCSVMLVSPWMLALVAKSANKAMVATATKMANGKMANGLRDLTATAASLVRGMDLWLLEVVVLFFLRPFMTILLTIVLPNANKAMDVLTQCKISCGYPSSFGIGLPVSEALLSNRIIVDVNDFN